METKHTKEYAKKIAEIKLENGTFVDLKTAIVWGYMKAIEEAKVSETLKSLISLQKRLDTLIMLTPTGEERNAMTEENIIVLNLINDLTN